MTRYDYNVDANEPYLIEFCQRCSEPDCMGICDAYRNEFRRHHGLPEIKVKQYKVRTLRPDEDWHKKGKFFAFGEWHTLSYFCRKYRIDYYTAYMRIYRYHMSIEDALTKPLVIEYREPRKYEIDGVTHTLREWSEIYGIPKKTMHNRLAAGWDYRKAITEPIHDRYRRTEKK